MLRYIPPAAKLFEKNRKKYRAHLHSGMASVFFSNEVLSRNADAHYTFKQNSNTYYLTGIDQEEVALWIFPDAPKQEWREILFIRETSEKIQVWEGWKYSKEEARLASGVQNVKYFGEFQGFLKSMLRYCEGVYLDFNEYEPNSINSTFQAHKLAQWLRQYFPAHKIGRAAPILDAQRLVKSEEELEQMKRATEVTHSALQGVLNFIQPGVKEYEIEAEIQHSFLRNRATGPAYSSIVASGKNACVLHYVQNSQVCKEGDMVLMDFGAEYGNYCSDLSRTVPVNGRFTVRQKQIYTACLNVFKAAKKLYIPGNTIDSLNQRVGQIMSEELLKMGLISAEEVKKQTETNPAYKKYFMHGTAHFIGLDTHDVGSKFEPFVPGMVLTCEPGIYIPEENLGIRIENDLVITENDPLDLMAGFPIEIEEIEQQMNNRKND